MNSRQEDKKLQDIIKEKKHTFKPAMVIYLLVFAYFIYVTTIVVTNYFTINKYSKEKVVLAQELEETKENVEELKSFIEHAKDPDFVEKIAREDLKMVKPDEKVYVVVK